MTNFPFSLKLLLCEKDKPQSFFFSSKKFMLGCLQDKQIFLHDWERKAIQIYYQHTHYRRQASKHKNIFEPFFFKTVRKSVSHNHFHNILRLLMFYQVLLSPQVKRWAIITYKHGIYELPHKLPNDFRLRKVGFMTTVSKLHRMIA